MLIVLVDIAYGLITAVAGGLLVWTCRSHICRRYSGNISEETLRARQVLTQLREWTACISANVDEHSSLVENISEDLKYQEVPDVNDVVVAVSKIVHVNEQMQNELVAAKRQLQEQAQIIEAQAAEVRMDALTRLANRRAFDDEMERRFAEFKRHGTTFCVMLLDLDHFKNFNDKYGHQAGDDLLRGVAGVLHQVMRDIDLVARYGGEEFAVILPRTSIEEAKVPAERTREQIELAAFRSEGVDLSITASVGVAQIRSSEHPRLLVRRADAAMYASKKAGRNIAHWHDGEAIHPITANLEDTNPPEPTPREESEPRETDPQSHSSKEGTQCASAGKLASTKTEERCTERSSEEGSPSGAASIKNLDLRDDSAAQLGDRTEFCHAARRRLAEWNRGGPTVSLVLLEINALDEVVRKYGAARGQSVLNTVGTAVLAAVREMDFVATYNPGCFGLLQANVSHDELLVLANRLHEVVDECSWPIADFGENLSANTGLATATEGDDLIRLLNRADNALSSARNDDECRSYFHNGQWSEAVQTVQVTDP